MKPRMQGNGHVARWRADGWFGRDGINCVRGICGLLLLLVLEGGSQGFAQEGAATPPAPFARDELRMRNGDILFGELESIEPATGIRWRHRDALASIEFKPDSVGEIFFSGTRWRQTNSPVNCQVKLTNDDELDGQLVSVDAEKVQLDTGLAGRITIPRKMVALLAPQGASRAAIFQGPTGIEGWTHGKVSTNLPDSGQWSFRNGAFYASKSASIARNLNLPDVGSIEFDLTWKGMLYVAVALYTDYLQPINLSTKDSEPDFSGFYSLQLNTYSANLLSVKKNDPLKYLGQVAVPAFSQKNAVHVEVRASKPKKLVALLVDGVLIKQWQDTDDFAGGGRGMRFVHQGQGSIKLANLRISEWDGQFEEKPTNPPDSKQDLVKLRNGDKLAGDVEDVRDGRLTMQVAGAKMTVPLDRVKQVELAGKKAERAPENATDVRAYFRRGGSVTFQLERWTPQGVTATSPNFGRVVFNPAAFEWIQFTDLNRNTGASGRSF